MLVAERSSRGPLGALETKDPATLASSVTAAASSEAACRIPRHRD
jgi:hypothetical protein